MGYGEHNEHDDELTELFLEFEEALRAHLKKSEEFRDLLEYLSKKHGNISLCVAAQFMGTCAGAGKKRAKRQRPVPVRFEITKNDLKFLQSLKIKLNG